MPSDFRLFTNTDQADSSTMALLLSNFVEHSGVIIYSTDVHGDLLWANASFCGLLGQSLSSLVGRNIRQWRVLSDWPGYLARSQSANHVMEWIDEALQTPSGTRYLVGFKMPLTDARGEQGVCIFAFDLSRYVEPGLRLADSERRLQLLFQKAPIAMGQDDGQRILQFNDKLQALTGYSAEEIATVDCWFEMLYPEPQLRRRNRAQWDKTVALAKQQNQAYVDPQEYRITRKDGSQRDVLISAILIGQEHLTLFHDITDRKLIKAQLQQSQERLSYALQGANDGLWDWNLETNEVYYSPRWMEMLGYAPRELPFTLDTWAMLVHPDNRQTTLDQVEAYLQGRLSAFEVEFRMQHKRGHWVDVLSRARLACDDNGQPISPRRLVGTHIDISEQKKAQAALQRSEAHYRKLFEASPDAIVILDVHGKCVTCNPSSLGMLKIPSLEMFSQLTIFDLSPAYQPDGQRSDVKAQACINQALQQGFNYFEWQHQRMDGEQFPSLVSVIPIELDGKIYVQGTIRDVTEQQQAQDKLKLAASVFDHAREGILITDASSIIIDVNDAFTHITGYAREEVIGKRPNILASGHHNPAFYGEMYRTLQQEGYWNGEVWNRHKNGHLYVELLNISEIRNAEGERTHYVGIFTDISLQKEHQKQLEHLAHYDSLTGLPNRVLLADRLQQAMAYSHRHGSLLAVTYIDLDGFKEINDRRGHEVGDQVLIEVAQSLGHLFRESDTLARIGGDEFVAVLTDIQSKEACVRFLNKILQAIAHPFYVNDEAVSVTASIGVSLYPQTQAVEADHLTRQADQAMYKAKLTGKNNFYIFDAEHDLRVRSRSDNAQRIKYGLERGEFVLYYQPKINLRTGEVFGAEALLRWQHPERGLLLPAFFLPEIEDHALEQEIGEWVIEAVLKQLQNWSRQGLRLQVSVNISAYQLQQLAFFDYIKAVLAAYPEVQPQQLEFEILETSALEDIRHVIELMKACTAIGVQFAIDDFGTGYSSLTYLKRLPSHMVKIDQTFIRDMFKDVEDLAIVKGVVDLASAFRRKVIAEGVESTAHANLLLQLGCDRVQGNGFACPMPPEQLLAWLSQWRADPAWAQIQVVKRELLPLLFAKVAQEVWLESALSHLSDDRPLQIKTPPLQQWLESEGDFTDLDHASLSLLTNCLAEQKTVIRLLQSGLLSRETTENALRQWHQQIIQNVNAMLRTEHSNHAPM